MSRQVDVQVFFHGPSSSLDALASACRQAAAKPEAFLAAWAGFGPMRWGDAFVERHRRGRLPQAQGPFGELAGLRAEAPPPEESPFSLDAGCPIPQRLLIEDSIGADPRAPEALAAAARRLENLRAFGHGGWHSWSQEHWGAPWDASDCSWSERQRGGRFVELRMRTRDSAPLAGLSRICSRFQIGGSCCFSCEGPGLAGLALIEPDGSIVHPPRTAGGAARLASSARALAMDRLGAMGEPVKAAPGASLAALMARGKPPSAKALARADAPPARSEAAADLAFGSVGPGCAYSSAQAAAALDGLSDLGALMPEDAGSGGVEIGLLLCGARWIDGARWALARCSDQFLRKAALCLAFSSLEANDPQAAELAARRLGPEDLDGLDWPAAFAHSPEAALALAGSDDMSLERAELFEAAMGSLPPRGIEGERLLGLGARIERARLAQSVPTPSAAPGRAMHL